MMKRLLTIVLFAMIALSLGVSGWAAPKKPPQNDDNLRRKTVYSFEDDTITGNLLKPDSTIVDSIKRSKYSSLIKIRTNFIPEIIKSAEDL